MNILIVTPSYNRYGKLIRLCKSLEQSTYKDFFHHIYLDNNDNETMRRLQNSNTLNYENWVEVNRKQEFVIGSWNKAFREFHDKCDAFLWLVDDVEVYPNTIEEAVWTFKNSFADHTDGVVGLAQECPGAPNYTFKWFGQCLIGREFLERYKDVDYKLCCPDYKHFYQDEEMYIFANELGRFVEAPNAIVKHYHPAFVREEMDETHPLVRGAVMKEDTAIYTERRSRNLVWGKSWELINEKVNK